MSISHPPSFSSGSYSSVPITLPNSFTTLGVDASMGSQGIGGGAQPGGRPTCTCGQPPSGGSFRPSGPFLGASKDFSDDTAYKRVPLRMKDGTFKQLNVKKWSTVAMFWKHLRAAMTKAGIDPNMVLWVEVELWNGARERWPMEKENSREEGDTTGTLTVRQMACAAAIGTVVGGVGRVCYDCRGEMFKASDS
jgi:hypothetical protein